MGLLTFVAAPVAVAMAAIAAYLAALSIAAFVAPPPTPRPGPAARRFAVLVPAHDEATVIERVLASLRAQTYPADRFDVFVVADNCTDHTAGLARAAGVAVYERDEPALRAKGHALRWLLERVQARTGYDAYVIFDADSFVAPDFLARMDARLASGALVVQGHYRTLNDDASAVVALREAALASLHYLRPLGRAAIGLSCGLKGNGMCFAAKVLDGQGWTSAGLAEDVELHLDLVRRGLRVEFAPEAVVRADMPATLEAARTQNVRWETGRLATVRRNALPLLRDGLTERDPVKFDAALEQLIPPLSVALCAAMGSAVAGALAGSLPVATIGLAAGGGLVFHVLAGLVAVRAPGRVYRALAGAPWYIVWKLGLYARASVAPKGQAWIRTERS